MIIVTGAAGFIGSNLAIRLAKEGAELILVDHPLTPEKRLNWEEGFKNFPFFEHLDFLDQLEKGKLMPDVIFHLGACSSTTETDWEYLCQNNIEYSKRIWNWCAREDIPLVYASSGATYGDGSLGFDDTTDPNNLRPLNLYGRSKNIFDTWVYKQISGGKNIPPRWAGMKFFNVYGPREAHKGDMASMVWKAYQEIIAGGEVSLFRSNDVAIRDGEQKRDFVYVEDCINHMLWLWQSPHNGGLYNSGTGHARTFIDLVLAVFVSLNREPRIQFIDMPDALSGQYQNLTEATMEKIKATGYIKSHTPLEDGVKSYIAAINR